MSAIIRWEEPPDRGTDKGEWGAVAEALRAQPGQWAVVEEGANQSRSGVIVQSIKRGRFAPFAPAGSFEATARTKNRKTKVYARYVGGDAS